MKKKTNLYFAEKEEKAVLDYINSDSAEEKKVIYNTILKEPFQKMIQSILRRYPIHIGNYEMEEVEQNALTHLIEHMVKYKPFIIERKKMNEEKWNRLGEKFRFIFVEDAQKMVQDLKEGNVIVNEDDIDEYFYKIFNSRAYSYCQTIVRNYFKDHGKKSYSEKKTILPYDDYVEEINQNIEYHYELSNNEEFHMLEILINKIVKKIDEMISIPEGMKKNEVVVGEAIVNVLKNWHILFMEDSPEGKYDKKVTNKFAKNKILLYLKEQTGLTTKEIRMAMKPFKELYFLEKQSFLED